MKPTLSFSEWLQLPVGEALLKKEQALSRVWLERVFGYHALHLGELPTQCVLQSRISHKIYLSNDEKATSLRATADAIPLRSASVDLIVLPHVLEFHANPHEVLREVSRVLIPEGILFITGFNPNSFWGLRRLIDRRNTPWNASYLSLHRLHDWLELMGFSTLRMESMFFRLPFSNFVLNASSEKSEAFLLKCWPLGGAVYGVMVQKRLSTLTPIRLTHVAKKKSIRAAWEPSTRDIHPR